MIKNTIRVCLLQIGDTVIIEKRFSKSVGGKEFIISDITPDEYCQSGFSITCEGYPRPIDANWLIKTKSVNTSVPDNIKTILSKLKASSLITDQLKQTPINYKLFPELTSLINTSISIIENMDIPDEKAGKSVYPTMKGQMHESKDTKCE